MIILKHKNIIFKNKNRQKLVENIKENIPDLKELILFNKQEVRSLLISFFVIWMQRVVSLYNFSVEN